MGKRMKKKARKKKAREKKKSVAAISSENAQKPFAESPKNPDIPTYDIFEDHHAGTSAWDFGECIENLIISLKDGYYAIWDAIIREEQGLPLSEEQEEMVDELLSFSDDDYDGPTLYIDGLPRPVEPWYESLNKLLPELILDPLKTDEIYNEIYDEGWQRIVDVLETYGGNLPLPEGIDDPLQVIDSDTRHRLWLQYCFEELIGLGQEEEMTLENEEESWRIGGFIERLKECKDSVEAFDLTLDTLFQRVKLPIADEKILMTSMVERLGIQSKTQKLYDVL